MVSSSSQDPIQRARPGNTPPSATTPDVVLSMCLAGSFGSCRTAGNCHVLNRLQHHVALGLDFSTSADRDAFYIRETTVVTEIIITVHGSQQLFTSSTYSDMSDVSELVSLHARMCQCHFVT